ncbi:hypothetical protein EPN18_09270 [bacterium]|nr:MAG: hypothetical protein EPN18_09270 [bacterium]
MISGFILPVSSQELLYGESRGISRKWRRLSLSVPHSRQSIIPSGKRPKVRQTVAQTLPVSGMTVKAESKAVIGAKMPFFQNGSFKITAKSLEKTGHTIELVLLCKNISNQSGIDISNTFSYTISMKIAISVQDDIFKELEAFAKERHCSRSEIFSKAVSEFLERAKSQRLFDALNEVYFDAEPVEEARLREAAKKRYRAALLKQRY